MDSRHLRPETVDQIDRSTREYFSRSSDRPDAVAVRRRPVQPQAIKKAKTRMRTAAWRCQLDRLRRPESYTVALAFLLAALRVESVKHLDPTVSPVFVAMLKDLIDRGYDPNEVTAVVRRLWEADKRRYPDPAQESLF
jgi:hypothetical protein